MTTATKFASYEAAEHDLTRRIDAATAAIDAEHDPQSVELPESVRRSLRMLVNYCYEGDEWEYAVSKHRDVGLREPLNSAGAACVVLMNWLLLQDLTIND